MTLLAVDQLSVLLRSSPSGSIVYLLGAGGCGVSALGHLFLDLGFQIVGSDLESNMAIDQLQNRGARIHIGHCEEHVLEAKPVVVIMSSAIPSGNVESLAAEKLKIPMTLRGSALACLIRMCKSVCVAGMHGKSTTSAMLAYALGQMDGDSSYSIGALVPQLNPHGRIRDVLSSKNSVHDTLFVAESDESDVTFNSIVPHHAIVLNVDHEHLDYFSGFDSVCHEFEAFANRVKDRLVYCADDASLARMFAGWSNAVSFGFSPGADYRAKLSDEASNVSDDAAIVMSRFVVFFHGKLLGEFAIRLAGEKNVSNATAVIAMLHQLRYSPGAIGSAMNSFRGVARRQDEIYRNSAVRVFEDYGHHPAEIRATLSALRGLNPGRLLVIFQPHRFSRTRFLIEDFGACFEQADRLWITDIYSAGEKPISGVLSESLVQSIRGRGQLVEHVSNADELSGILSSEIQQGDMMLFLGAGDIHRMASSFVDHLRSSMRDDGADFCQKLRQELSSDALVRQNEVLARRTTLRVGGCADFYIEPRCESDLAAVLRICTDFGLPITVIGRGSNLLIRDGGVRGAVVCLARAGFDQIEFLEGQLHCGAGAKLKAVAATAKGCGLGGLEFMEGIPGTIGGALRMNAGAMGSAMFEVLHSVRFMSLDGTIHSRTAAELNVQYRSCPIFKNNVALGAVLNGQPDSKETIAETMRKGSAKRWNSQPAASSAGCIFKNPTAIPAGRLIEELGLKGERVGGAVVSDVHGNFIVNDGNATARDVLRLIEIVQERVQVVRGIQLETEVEIIGENLEEGFSEHEFNTEIQSRIERIEPIA